jgi:hypothetical protein
MKVLIATDSTQSSNEIESRGGTFVREERFLKAYV